MRSEPDGHQPDRAQGNASSRNTYQQQGNATILYCPTVRTPSIHVDSPQFNETAVLMLDSESEINLIKYNILQQDANTDFSQITTVKNIANTPVLTCGISIVKIFGTEVLFHVVPNDFPIPQDGIIGYGFI